MCLNVNILDLIPQRNPILMIDSLISYDDESATTEFIIKDDNVFCNDGDFSEVGLVENIAQTCAARIGYIELIIKHNSVSIGLVGSVNNLKINVKPSIGDKLITKIILITELGSMTKYHATVTNNDFIVAECDMSVSVMQ